MEETKRTRKSAATFGPTRRTARARVRAVSLEGGRRLPAVDRHVRIPTGDGERPEHLFRRLLGAYLGGATSYEVVQRPRLATPARQAVRWFVERTGSPKVTDEARTTIYLTDPGLTTEEAGVPRLLRLGRRVVRAHRRAVRAWDDLPTYDVGTWQEFDRAVDSEAWQLQRSVLAGDAGRCAVDVLAFWTMARALERIGDEAVALGQLGARLAGPGDVGAGREIRRAVRQLHEQAVRLLGEALSLTTSERANDLLDVAEALSDSCRTLSDDLLIEVGRGTVTPVSAVAVDRALAAISRTLSHIAELVQVGLDRPSAGKGGPTEGWGEGRAPSTAARRRSPEAVLGHREQGGSPAEGPCDLFPRADARSVS